MAVPKRRQTKARRDKRRATHRLKAPRVNECPVCHQPKQPHRVCPTCKTYRGREVEPLRRRLRSLAVASAWRSTPWAATGARRRSSRARSRPRPTGSSRDLFGPAGLDTKGLELVEAPDAIAMHEKPVEAVRAKPDSSLVAACRAVGDGEADAVVSAGNTGATLAARPLPHPPAARSRPPRDRGRHPRARRPVRAPRLGRQRGRSPGAPPPVRPDGRDLRRGGARDREARGAAPLDRRGAGEGNQLTLEAHQLLAASDLNFGGNVESRHLLSTPATWSSATASPATSA